MRWFQAIAISAVVVMAATASGGGAVLAQSPAKCVRAGGSANMITRDLAEFMAKAALGNSIKGMQRKPVGPIKLTCKNGATVYCLARQKACK